MKRLVTLLMAVSLAVVLCACSNPLKTATDVVESTTETTVVLEDPSVLPSFVIYDANDNTQIALTLGAVYADWHYLDESGSEQTIESGDASLTASETAADASGDASGDAVSAADTAAEAAAVTTADASGDASGDAAVTADSGNMEAILAAAYLSLPTLDVDDDSEIYYIVDPGATPDCMEETSWKAEYIGSESADAMEIYTKLANFDNLPLKANRIYQVDVIWEEENFEDVGYWGTLTYMFMTE